MLLRPRGPFPAFAVARRAFCSAPAADSTPTARVLKYSLSRSAGGQLRVYTEYKNQGARIYTRVRGFTGDSQSLADEIRVLVGPKPEIVIRPGRIQVKGNHSQKLKLWFERLGF
mmetsp:Transcript_26618/g.37878  ORF Transcript_26618/g.37878 Transcript_26618/m.37878 type:complete len:114 (-) Transcript_26618:10-351(-)